MGGFVYYINDDNKLADEKNIDHKIVTIFSQKGLKLNKKIKSKKFTLYTYYKYSNTDNNFWQNNRNEFIAGFGTFIYKKKNGEIALEELFNDFRNNVFRQENLAGNYAIIIYQNDEVFIFNDYFGQYRIYYNNSKKIFSNSFIALKKLCKSTSINKQEMYEYVLNGAYYGENTIFKEIKLIDGKKKYKILPNQKEIRKEIAFNLELHKDKFDDIISKISQQQIQYFISLKNCFGKNISSALTGGYDSRLMLALILKSKSKPNLFVYGKESNSDVKIAKTIANYQSLDLDHIDKSLTTKLNSEEFLTVLNKNFYIQDGLGNTGIFDNGSDLETRLNRTQNIDLLINGGGGEIYRNFWKIMNRKVSIKQFIKSGYDFSDYRVCTQLFNRSEYLHSLMKKVKNELEIDRDYLFRNEAELLYPYFRLKYWMSINNSINNQFSYYITPFSEPCFVFPSSQIPIKYKNCGLFQANLIKAIEPDIAKYQSAYRYNFYDKLNNKIKIKSAIVNRIPFSLRPAIRQYKRRNKAYPKYYYFDSIYLKKIFDEKYELSKYFNIDIVRDPDILSRILSIEILVKDIL